MQGIRAQSGARTVAAWDALVCHPAAPTPGRRPLRPSQALPCRQCHHAMHYEYNALTGSRCNTEAA
eukprot:scaffold8068_cov565-Prasinococcus_capsulatus_cf.AAC.11